MALAAVEAASALDLSRVASAENPVLDPAGAAPAEPFLGGEAVEAADKNGYIVIRHGDETGSRAQGAG